MIRQKGRYRSSLIKRLLIGSKYTPDLPSYTVYSSIMLVATLYRIWEYS
jgi:hypothetical protein